MAVHTFDVAAFRLQFPAFASETAYPSPTLEGYFVMATCYINDTDQICGLNGDCLQLALNLLTAHFASIYTAANVSPIPAAGIQTSASIDKVSVTTTLPPYGTSPWRFWLLRTPYGEQLLALLMAKSAGGFYIGGSPERQGFRKAFGRF